MAVWFVRLWILLLAMSIIMYISFCVFCLIVLFLSALLWVKVNFVYFLVIILYTSQLFCVLLYSEHYLWTLCNVLCKLCTGLLPSGANPIAVKILIIRNKFWYMNRWMNRTALIMGLVYLFHEIYRTYLQFLDNFRSEFLTLKQDKVLLSIYDSKHFQLSSKTTNFRTRFYMNYFALILKT